MRYLMTARPSGPMGAGQRAKQFHAPLTRCQKCRTVHGPRAACMTNATEVIAEIEVLQARGDTMTLTPKTSALDARKVTTGLGVEYRSMIATQYNLRDLKRAARTNGYTALTVIEQTAQRVHVREYAL